MESAEEGIKVDGGRGAIVFVAVWGISRRNAFISF
jgi:hypothetical protein